MAGISLKEMFSWSWLTGIKKTYLLGFLSPRTLGTRPSGVLGRSRPQAQFFEHANLEKAPA
jgi:hypothetical protein